MNEDKAAPSSTGVTFQELGRHSYLDLLEWDEWCHRKVESLHLLEGERAIRRVSVDCTPRVGVTNEGLRHLYVPLTWIHKDVMRSFDLVDAQGSAVPALGRRDNGEFCVGVVIGLLADDPNFKGRAEVLARLADELVFGDSQTARAALEALTAGPDSKQVVEDLLQKMVENFLLIAVLDKGETGRRIILKFSYHWESDTLLRWEAEAKVVDRVRALLVRSKEAWFGAVGISTLDLQLELAAVDTAATYHLEVPCPPGLRSRGLRLLAQSEVVVSDERLSSVAHVYVTSDQLADHSIDAGVMEVDLNPNGSHRTIWLASLAAFAILLGPTLNAAWLCSLKSDSGGGTSLLLFGPALLLTLLVREGENVVTSSIYRPLRLLALALAGQLFLAGALLVAGLSLRSLQGWWLAFTCFSGLIAAVLSWGTVRLRRGTNKQVEGGNL